MFSLPSSPEGNSHNAVVERLLRSSRDKRLSGGGEVFMIIECDLLKDARFVSSKFLRRPRKKRWLVINLRGAVECGPAAAGKHDNKLSAEANVPQDEEADACSQYSVLGSCPILSSMYRNIWRCRFSGSFLTKPISKQGFVDKHLLSSLNTNLLHLYLYKYCEYWCT